MDTPVFYIALVVCFLVCIVRYSTLEPFYWKWCLPYLLMNLLVETYGLISREKGANNVWAYNLSTTLEFAFYFYLFYRSFSGEKIKRLIVIFSSVYFPFAFLNIFFIQGWTHFHSYSFLPGSIFLILLALSYFREIITNIEVVNPLTLKLFWIATGVLFFYFGSFLYLGLFEYIHLNNPSLENFFQIVVNYLNVVLYCMFIISFYVKETQ